MALSSYIKDRILTAFRTREAANTMIAAFEEAMTIEASELNVDDDVSFNDNKITDLADPTDPQDAATMQYVLDNAGGGGFANPATEDLDMDGNNITNVESILSPAAGFVQVLDSGLSTGLYVEENYVEIAIGTISAKVSIDPSSIIISAPSNTRTIVQGGPLKLAGLASDPASPEDGDVWYNNIDNKLRVYENGVTTDVVGGGGFTNPAEEVLDMNGNDIDMNGGTLTDSSETLLSISSPNNDTIEIVTGSILIKTGDVTGTDAASGDITISVGAFSGDATDAGSMTLNAGQTFSVTCEDLSIQGPDYTINASGGDMNIQANGELTLSTDVVLSGNIVPSEDSGFNLGADDLGFNKVRTYVVQSPTASGGLQLDGNASSVINLDSTMSITSNTRIDMGSSAGPLRLPTMAADPGTPQDGDIWHNTTSDTIKVRLNGATLTLVTV